MWTDLLLKAAIAMAMKLLTETFIARGIIRASRALADKTTNTLDDGMVDDLAEALSQPDLKKKA
jgi:hypothetical protein